MRTRGTWFVIALLGLALVSTPLASAAQSSQGRGEQVWQGHLDREELANREALASRQQGGQVTYRCSDITLRIYPDGTADLTNAECTITIVVTKSGVTTSTDTYVVELDALQGVDVGNMTTTQRMTKTRDYLENGQAKHRVDRFGPTPARVTLTKVGTDRLLRTANGPSGIGSVAWRLFGTRSRRRPCGRPRLRPRPTVMPCASCRRRCRTARSACHTGNGSEPTAERRRTRWRFPPASRRTASRCRGSASSPARPRPPARTRSCCARRTCTSASRSGATRSSFARATCRRHPGRAWAPTTSTPRSAAWGGRRHWRNTAWGRPTPPSSITCGWPASTCTRPTRPPSRRSRPGRTGRPT